MDDIIHFVQRPVKPFPVTDVADEPAKPGVIVEHSTYFQLLELVSAENHKSSYLMVIEQLPDERLPQ
jgi:hypothetical protein